MKARQSQFTWAVQALHLENRRQRSLPNGPIEHWGWIPIKHDRVKILKQIGHFSEQTNRSTYVFLCTHSYSSLALSYYLEALPVYAPDYPDSLDTSTCFCYLSKDSATNRENSTKYRSVWNTVYQRTAHSAIRYMVQQNHNSS